MLILVQKSRVDLSMFEDKADCWIHYYKEKNGDFFRIDKEDMSVTQQGYDATVNTFLGEGVIVEVDVLINI